MIASVWFRVTLTNWVAVGTITVPLAVALLALKGKIRP